MLLILGKLYSDSFALVFILKDYRKCHICILNYISISLGTLLKDILKVSQSIFGKLRVALHTYSPLEMDSVY